jgi:hypothetical protein
VGSDAGAAPQNARKRPGTRGPSPRRRGLIATARPSGSHPRAKSRHWHVVGPGLGAQERPVVTQPARHVERPHAVGAHVDEGLLLRARSEFRHRSKTAPPATTPVLCPCNTFARSTRKPCTWSALAIALATMGDQATQIGTRSGRSSRRLIAIAICYALLIQSFLLGLIGAQLVSPATGNGIPDFELCLSSGHGASPTPDKAPDYHAVQRCTLCLCGADVSLAPLPQSSFLYVSFEAARARQVADDGRLPQSVRYSIARPRGPPGA